MMPNPNIPRNQMPTYGMPMVYNPNMMYAPQPIQNNVPPPRLNGSGPNQSYDNGNGPSFELLTRSSLQIVKGEHYQQTFSLPSHLYQVKPFEFKYNFSTELECISQTAEERRKEEKMKEREEQKRKERALKAQLEAWQAIQEKRNRTQQQNISSPSAAPPRLTSSGTLVDLDFEGDEATAATNSKEKETKNLRRSQSEEVRPPSFSSPKSEQVHAKMVEMGFDSKVVRLILDLIGPDNELKVINFVTSYSQLEEDPCNFSRLKIAQALLLYDGDRDRALTFLREMEVLMRNGITDDMLAEALLTFQNDIKAASSYLMAYKSLRELGFSDLKTREALVMSNNDSQKAVQYLLENPA